MSLNCFQYYTHLTLGNEIVCGSDVQMPKLYSNIFETDFTYRKYCKKSRKNYNINK